MRNFLCGLLGLLLLGAAAQAQVEGSWQGTLDVGAQKLRLKLDCAKKDGALACVLTSVDQGGVELKADGASFAEGRLTATWKAASAQYVGKLSTDGATLEGDWSQMFNKWPMAFHRAEAQAAQPSVAPVEPVAPATPARPQTPKPPFPYMSEEVSYTSERAGVKFAATLTLPAGKGPFAAIVLLPGSGAHDRDETVFGHKPFLVLADALTRAGYAVLRFDQRGVGASSGTMRDTTVFDEADDAEAGLQYLLTRAEIDHKRIGLLGHSEGGEVAPVVAERRKDAAFVIGVGAPAVKGSEMIIEQVRQLVLLHGGSPEQAAKQAAAQRELLDAVLGGKSGFEVASLLVKLSDGKLDLSQATAAAAQLLSKSYMQLIAYDPQPTLRKLRCPMLAIYGAKDTQVTAAQNAEPMREALRANGVKASAVVVLPGLNHLLQHAETGSIDEYGKIEETLAPEAIERITQWLHTIDAR